MGTLLQLLVRSFETGSIYALATLGIILIFRTSRTVNFAQGTMGMFCTYAATYMLSSKGLSVYAAAFIGVIVAVLMGIVIDVLIFRRAGKVSAISKQVITLGVLMIILGITPVIFGIELMSFPKFIETGSMEFSGASISYNGLLNILIGIAITLILFFMIQKSKVGLAIRATASNETTARMLGIPAKNVTMLAWSAAAVLGCLSGVMIAPSTTVTLTLMDSVQLNAFLACVLGGFQTFHGPVIAAYIIGVARNLIVYYVNSVWGEQILYLFVFLFIVFKPNGLIGKAAVKKV